MNSIQIECFLALAECGSFSRTAEKMYLAQPTLSKYIMSMENELEMQLIDRSHRKIELTPAGHVMYDYYKDAIEKFSDAVFRALNLGKEQTSLKVVLLEGLDTDQIVKPLLDYQFFNSHVNISFEQLPAHQIPILLASGKYDLAITMEDRIQLIGKTNKNIEYAPILPGKLNLYYSEFHPANTLARNPAFADFSDDVFLFPKYVSRSVERGGIQKEDSINLYREYLGYMPRFKYVDSVAAILPNLLGGNCVSILSEHCRLHASTHIKYMPFPVRSDIVYAWCTERETDLIRDVIKFNHEHSAGMLMS